MLCKSCSKEVTQKEASIQCELCIDWYHIQCVGVSSEEYKFLKKYGQSYHWFCPNCEKGAINILRKITSLQEDQTVLKQTVKLLEGAIEKVQEDMSGCITLLSQLKVQWSKSKKVSEKKCKRQFNLVSVRKAGSAICSRTAECIWRKDSLKKSRDKTNCS